jgi:acyl carrier protein
MIENIQKILGSQLGKDPLTIFANQTIIGDLGADSLDIVEIIVSIEEEFNIEIENSEYSDLTTVGELMLLIELKIKDKNIKIVK